MINAVLDRERTTTNTEPLYQWDYGQVIRIQGIKLPPAVEIHFADEFSEDSITRIGTTKDGVTEVTIPDSLLERAGKILSYIYVSNTDSGKTEYKISTQIKNRAKPEAFDTPGDEELFHKAIEEVNASAMRSEAAHDEVLSARESVEEIYTEVLNKAQQVADDTTATEAVRAEVLNKAQQVADDTTATEAGRAEVEKNTALANNYMESAAGFAKNASTSEAAAKKSEENATLATTGFDLHVEGKKQEIKDAGVEEIRKVTEAGESQVKLVSEAGETIIDQYYKEKVLQATTKKEVDELFAGWWDAKYDSETYTKVEMLERWFGYVMDDERVHGVETPLYTKSTSMLGTLTDDSEGLVCTPSTVTTAGTDQFAHLPQFWCLEVSAEKNADGTHEIFYVEHIDDTADVRSGEHLCWVLQKNTYKREWRDNEYTYLKTRCHPAPGYKRWPEGKDKTGKVYAYMAHPKYYAGVAADGSITCGTGLKPINRISYSSGIAKWRTRGEQYSGASGSLLKFLDCMVRLKYARKGNSGKIEGCTSYNYQYTAAVSETNVERVILTTAQAANFLEGSTIMLGVQSGTDRNTASNYSICDGKKIAKIENVTIDGTEYSAVYIDNGGTTFDTTAGSTYISTAPYISGWNNEVLGTDGSRISPTSGKEPGLIQKVEFMNGSCMILSDELWNWSTDTDGNYNFDCYKCYDQSKAASAITGDYEKQEGLTLVFPAGTTGSWRYITDNAVSDIVEWPETANASGSGVGVGAGFYCNPAAYGVRAPWSFGHLYDGGIGGVACRDSRYSVGVSYWNGSLGATGLDG